MCVQSASSWDFVDGGALSAAASNAERKLRIDPTFFFELAGAPPSDDIATSSLRLRESMGMKA